ncbi:unnamed protein product [Timema podura]|uniref:Uncharacterized protein n=1 Tax=Timema podura TaxID=61482 RepID=A0ABN7PFC3_TIMPD|nr:unnamed protein product [Timema podura]
MVFDVSIVSKSDLHWLDCIVRSRLSSCTQLRDGDKYMETWKGNARNWECVEIETCETPRLTAVWVIRLCNNYANSLGFRRLYLEEVNSNLHGRKTTLITSDWNSNFDLHVIGNLIYCKSSDLDHSAESALLRLSPVNRPIKMTKNPISITEREREMVENQRNISF